MMPYNSVVTQKKSQLTFPNSNVANNVKVNFVSVAGNRNENINRSMILFVRKKDSRKIISCNEDATTAIMPDGTTDTLFSKTSKIFQMFENISAQISTSASWSRQAFQDNMYRHTPFIRGEQYFAIRNIINNTESSIENYLTAYDFTRVRQSKNIDNSINRAACLRSVHRPRLSDLPVYTKCRSAASILERASLSKIQKRRRKRRRRYSKIRTSPIFPPPRLTRSDAKRRQFQITLLGRKQFGLPIKSHPTLHGPFQKRDLAH